MFFLLSNITVYIFSEDYRFFIKKLKYKDEIVYTSGPHFDDADVISPSEKNSSWTIQDIIDDIWWTKEEVEENSSTLWLNFLDVLAGKSNSWSVSEEQLPKLTWSQENFLGAFSGYTLKELESQSSLFGITTEYPDAYYEYYSPELTLYIFPTKNYEEVLEIFEVLEYDLAYSLNQENNFGQASFYINFDTAYRDEFVRVVMKYKNKAFWLKISKDIYNDVKQILASLR